MLKFTSRLETGVSELLPKDLGMYIVRVSVLKVVRRTACRLDADCFIPSGVVSMGGEYTGFDEASPFSDE